MQFQQQMDLVKGQQKQHFDLPMIDHKLSDFLRSNLDSLEGLYVVILFLFYSYSLVLGLSSSNKDLLALHNCAWASSAGLSLNDEKRNTESGGQDKIVRAFAEVMKNMQRMKTYVRPAMCKPYGKQSEALQKSTYV